MIENGIPKKLCYPEFIIFVIFDLSFYQSLKSILNNAVSAENDLTFSWNIRTDEKCAEDINLIPNGNNISVNEENKFLFVEKV